MLEVNGYWGIELLCYWVIELLVWGFKFMFNRVIVESLNRSS